MGFEPVKPHSVWAYAHQRLMYRPQGCCSPKIEVGTSRQTLDFMKRQYKLKLSKWIISYKKLRERRPLRPRPTKAPICPYF